MKREFLNTDYNAGADARKMLNEHIKNLPLKFVKTNGAIIDDTVKEIINKYEIENVLAWGISEEFLGICLIAIEIKKFIYYYIKQDDKTQQIAKDIK